LRVTSRGLGDVYKRQILVFDHLRERRWKTIRAAVLIVVIWHLQVT
jgi:hypothetical protein